MTVLIQRLESFLQQLPPVSGYGLALSGGLDSSALLDALSRCHGESRLRAIHIHHGLQADADHWVEHCHTLCRHYDVPLQVYRVDAKAAPGESPEAAARRARYARFEQALQPDECLFTAQHRNDQAETILLQLLRGSGPAGLASMPAITAFAGGWLARPWLQCTREEIARYAAVQRLHWVEDSSNLEQGFDRNYLRARVMPVLLERWPAALRTLSRSADLQAQASELLEQLASEDLQRVRYPHHVAALCVTRLKECSPARIRNVLRYWIVLNRLTTPTAAQLEQILEALSARADSTPMVVWSGGGVGRYQNALYALAPEPPTETQRRTWAPGQSFSIPQLGIQLDSDYLTRIGLAPERFSQPLTVGFREGGERIRLPGRKHRHRLKKLLQEHEVPPWLRERLPLLFHGNELVAVLGLEPPIVADGWN